MELKKILKSSAFIFGLANLVLLSSSAIFLYLAFKNSSMQMSESYLDSTFAIFKDELLGDLIIDNNSVAKSLLFNISKEKNIGGEISGRMNFEFGFHDKNYDFEKTYDLSYGDTKFGILRLGVASPVDWYYFALNLAGIILAQLTILGAVYFKIKKRLERSLFLPLGELSEAIARGVSEAPKMDSETSREILNLSGAYTSMRIDLEKNNRVSAEIERAKAVELVVRQVAHDIRSPLSALDIVLSNAASLPEDVRVLARSAIVRIKDIANNLISKNKQDNKSAFGVRASVHGTESRSAVSLVSLIDSLVSEKRTQFRSFLNVDLEFLIDSHSYGVFVFVSPSELMRAISNLLNNAVEAMPDNKGRIVVSLKPLKDRVEICIEDNGMGIPEEEIPRLGNRGHSFGKRNLGSESGSGLGLYHARKTVHSYGGSLEIRSKLGEGTTVTLFLPVTPAPSWFVNKLIVPSRARIMIVDDDASIHQIWVNRFKSLSYGGQQVSISHCSNPRDLMLWMSAQSNISDVLFLVDFEFLGSDQNGLQLIEDLKISQQSILVTSRNDEPDLMIRATDMGLKIIPKGMAGYIPLILSESQEPPFTMDVGGIN